MERLVLILFILATEPCGCAHSNSTELPQPRDQSPIDINLIITLFSIICGLLSAIVLFCLLKSCFKRYCKTHRQTQSTSTNVGVNHSQPEQVLCERHCLQCIAEQGGHYPPAQNPGSSISRVPRQLYGQPRSVESQAQNPGSSTSRVPQQPYGQPPVESQAQNPGSSTSRDPQQLYGQPPSVESQAQNNLSESRDTTNKATVTQLAHNIVSNEASNDLTNGCGEGQVNLNDEILSQLNIDNLEFNQIEGTLRELLIPTDQSAVKTIAGKSLVYITHEVDSNGDVLTLDNMGVSLHIPRNAVAVGKKQSITLALSWDLSDAPSLDSSQAHVSPVIYCGPHGLKLEKPCILSYKHCAYDPKNIKVMVSETEITDEKNWESLCCVEDCGKCVVTLDECHIRLNHFSLLTSTQMAVEGNAGKKWLQVAVFASPLVPTVNHYQIRVYFFNKTPCNLQWAIFHEAQFGGKLVCPEKTFLFSGGGEDMRIKLHYISECWIPVDETGSDKVSFLQIWHNQCPHASMCFKRSDRHKASCKGSMDEINIQFLMFQENHEDGTEKIIIHMAKDRILEDISDPRSTKHGFDSVNIHLGSSANAVSGSPIVRVRQTSDTSHDIRVELGHEERVDLDDIQQSLSERQTIPVILKHQLVLMLDPRCPFHHDWRELAARLGLDKVIPYLEGKYSPTSIILQHLENKGKTLLELYNILKEMEREDAASFVEKYLLNPLNRVPTECDAY